MNSLDSHFRVRIWVVETEGGAWALLSVFITKFKQQCKFNFTRLSLAINFCCSIHSAVGFW